MNFLFAWRYFKAKKSTNAINVIAWISIVAITCISFAFVVVLSVFNGFEGLVKSLYSSFYTDIRVTPKIGKMITVTPEQLQRLKSITDIRGYSLVVEDKTLVLSGDIQVIVQMKGVDSNYEHITGVSNKLIRGEFNLGSPDNPSMVLGNGVENALQLQSDKNLFPVTVYAFKPGMSINATDPYQGLAAGNVNTTGTFLIQQDIDNKFAITNLAFMKLLTGLSENEYTSVEMALYNEDRANAIKKEVEKIFGNTALVQTKYEQNQSLYAVMTLEKWAIYAILTLMLIVAAFTMIGGLTMLVLEKQKDIQVLKAMGANNRLIQKIFLTEGLLLAFIGMTTGIVLAIIFCWAQVKFKLITIPGATFLIDHYPVQLVGSDFVLVIATVGIVATLASFFPSRKAALQPIELKS
jgi:lipoprotein-releasing system permease protein